MYKSFRAFVLLGLAVVFAGGLLIAPRGVFADALNPQLMELIGKNPDAECILNGEVIPYGNTGYVSCETSPSSPTCPQTQSKYYKFLGNKENNYYFCPIAQYEVAQCEQGEEVMLCGNYYPDGSSGGFDSAPEGVSCGGQKFPYVVSSSTGQQSESAELKRFKKELRFLIARYSKFDTTEKYCKKIPQPVQAITQEQGQEPTTTPAAPVNDRSMILLGAIIASVAVIAGVFIVKIRRSA